MMKSEGNQSAVRADAVAFLDRAGDAARRTLPGGESTRHAEGGLVAATVRFVIPANVAAALEWGEDALSLAEYIREWVIGAFEADFADGDCLPEEVRNRLGIDAGRIRETGILAAKGGYDTPTAEEREEALDALGEILAAKNRIAVEVDATTFVRLQKEAERLGTTVGRLGGSMVDAYFAKVGC